MRTTPAIRMMSLALGFALLGCGDDDSPPGLGGGGGGTCGVLGTSNVTVSGAVSASVNQCAYYAVIPATTTDPAGFGLVLTAGSQTNPTHAINFGREGTRPATGTYTVGGTGTTDWNGAFFYDAATDRTFALTSGTVTITTSNQGNLAGTVNMTGTEITGSTTPPTVTITGSFAAKCVDGPDNDC